MSFKDDHKDIIKKSESLANLDLIFSMEVNKTMYKTAKNMSPRQLNFINIGSGLVDIANHYEHEIMQTFNTSRKSQNINKDTKILIKAFSTYENADGTNTNSKSFRALIPKSNEI